MSRRLPPPAPRGELSAVLLDHLRTGSHGADDVLTAARRAVGASTDPLADDDLQLALLLCYELHYRGIAGVDDDVEWDPGVVAVRRAVEDAVLAALRQEADGPDLAPDEPVDVALRRLVEADDGPSLAKHVRRHATVDQVRELLVLRSVYQLKEGDPHTWAIPRLDGAAKAALVEIQADEYGGGRPDRMHSALFATTMRALGLDDGYGAHVDRVPALGLATSNAVTLFALRRRLRGAAVGHLAAYEMTSSLPNAWWAEGLRRLGYGPAATDFFDEHVEADAVHEQLAAADLCGGLVRDEPRLRPDVLFGARAALALDARLARHVLHAWDRGHSCLRQGDAARPTRGEAVCA